jgi:plasmid stabilization system protein ParE
VSRIRWAPQATDDLQAIRDFIGRDSPRYATMVVEGIVASVDILATFPWPDARSPSTRGKISANSFGRPIESSTVSWGTACIS